MSKQIITEAEYEVMKILWDATAPIPLGDILKKLDGKWARNTVGTMLSRMCEKGVVSCHTGGKSYMYYAVLQKEDYILNETKSFLSRLYAGSVSALVDTLCKHHQLHNEEVNKLKNIIDSINNT